MSTRLSEKSTERRASLREAVAHQQEKSFGGVVQRVWLPHLGHNGAKHNITHKASPAKRALSMKNWESALQVTAPHKYNERVARAKHANHRTKHGGAPTLMKGASHDKPALRRKGSSLILATSAMDLGGAQSGLGRVQASSEQPAVAVAKLKRPDQAALLATAARAAAQQRQRVALELQQQLHANSARLEQRLEQQGLEHAAEVAQLAATCETLKKQLAAMMCASVAVPSAPAPVPTQSSAGVTSPPEATVAGARATPLGALLQQPPKLRKRSSSASSAGFIETEVDQWLSSTRLGACKKELRAAGIERLVDLANLDAATLRTMLPKTAPQLRNKLLNELELVELPEDE